MGQVLEFVAESADLAVGVLMLVVAAGCTRLGWAFLRRPRESLVIVRGPGWLVRARGLCHLLLGLGLAAGEMGRIAGEEPTWTLNLVRWIAGPLAALPLLAGEVRRRREHRTDRVTGEGRWA